MVFKNGLERGFVKHWLNSVDVTDSYNLSPTGWFV